MCAGALGYDVNCISYCWGQQQKKIETHHSRACASPLLGCGVYVFSTLPIVAKLLLKVTVSYFQYSFLFYHILSLDFCDRVSNCNFSLLFLITSETESESFLSVGSEQGAGIYFLFQQVLDSHGKIIRASAKWRLGSLLV